MLNKLKNLKKQGDEGKLTFLYQFKHTVVHLSLYMLSTMKWFKPFSCLDSKDTSSSSSDSDVETAAAPKNAVHEPKFNAADVENIIENINPAYRYSKPVEEHKN